MNTILKVSDLCKTFTLHQFKKKITGCRDVGFSVNKGQFVGITGKSGAGKSTILKCIYRSYLPTSGEMLFNSRLLGEVNLARCVERDIVSVRRQEIGYISQFLKVLPQVTALDMVAETLIDTGYNKEQANAQARSMLSHFQIPENLWDTYPNTFSGGEKLRLNLAQAMIKSPRLLLLDEPTASLDEHSKGLVKEMIIKLKNSGTAMVGIFHDLAFMRDIVDIKYRMDSGYLKENFAV